MSDAAMQRTVGIYWRVSQFGNRRKPKKNCTSDHVNDCTFVQCTCWEQSEKRAAELFTCNGESKSAESLFTRNQPHESCEGSFAARCREVDGAQLNARKRYRSARWFCQDGRIPIFVLYNFAIDSVSKSALQWITFV